MNRQLPRALLIFLAGLTVAYAAYLAWFHAPYASGSDSSGYLNSARLLLSGHASAPLLVPEGLTPDIVPREYLVPLGFRLDLTQQRILPSYPAGLPLHFAALGILFGLGPATTIVGVASALAFAALLYFTSREFGVRPYWSLGVAVLGALSPLTQHYALQPMSDLVAAVWSLAVVLCALRSHRHAGWALAAGMALAVAVLVRPTNVFLLLPAAVALRPSFRTWTAFGLGGLPGALFLCLYNHSLYGAYVTTGYGDVSPLFAAKNVAITLRHYALWIPVVASPLVLAAAALPWTGLDRRKKYTLVAWSLPILLFYSAYECTHETWWYLRFILPALPALGIAAALALQRLNYPTWYLASRLLPAGAAPELLARGRVLSVPVILLLGLGAAWWQMDWTGRLRAAKIEQDERAYPLAGRWLAANLPANALLVAHQISGAALHYADLPSLNPNLLTPPVAARVDKWAREHRKVMYAALYPYEEDVVWKNLPGRWELVTRIRVATIWRRIDSDSPPAPRP
ncbi:MAG TPA: hypothetical protein VHN79_00425 [Lacunisphaera sp.]|nr:hypothetical protein [Lacunisphaera sp.]